MTAVFDNKDKFHITSFKFIDHIIQANIKIIMPNLALVELAGAISRKGNPLDDLVEYLDLLKAQRNFQFMTLNTKLCDLASDIAMQLKIKGSDSVYVAIAYRYNLKLITNDAQQMECGKKIISASTPEEELQTL